MTPYYEQDGITIYHGDCMDVLPSLDWTSAIVVSDPPYGTGGWRRMETGQGDNPAASLVIEDWDEGATDWLGLVKADAVLAFWPAARTRLLLEAADNAGLTKHRALYMQKLDPKPQVQNRIKWSMEPVWCLAREGFQLYGGTDVMAASTPRLGRDRDATGHPYEKPIEVMIWLIAKTKHDLIIDPFMGSGTTLRAAKDMGRRAIGIELEEKYCEIAAKRLQQQVLDLTA